MVTNTESNETVIEEFQARLQCEVWAKSVKVELTPATGEDGLSLDLICVPKNMRNQGYADRIMTLLTSLCDKYCKEFQVIPHALDHETNMERLEKLYVHHGFARLSGDDSVMRRNFSAGGNSGWLSKPSE